MTILSLPPPPSRVRLSLGGVCLMRSGGGDDAVVPGAGLLGGGGAACYMCGGLVEEISGERETEKIVSYRPLGVAVLYFFGSSLALTFPHDLMPHKPAGGLRFFVVAAPAAGAILLHGTLPCLVTQQEPKARLALPSPCPSWVALAMISSPARAFLSVLQSRFAAAAVIPSQEAPGDTERESLRQSISDEHLHRPPEAVPQRHLQDRLQLLRQVCVHAVTIVYNAYSGAGHYVLRTSTILLCEILHTTAACSLQHALPSLGGGCG